MQCLILNNITQHRKKLIKYKVQKVKKTLRIYQNIIKNYDEINYRRSSGSFQFEEKPFSKHAERISKIYH